MRSVAPLRSVSCHSQVSMFCSGHTFFVQHMPAKLGLEPYVAHATFQFGEPGRQLC